MTRRRRQILIVVSAVVVIGCGWMFGQSVSLMNRAKLLHLGMTEAEVLAIMGQEDNWWEGTSGYPLEDPDDVPLHVKQYYGSTLQQRERIRVFLSDHTGIKLPIVREGECPVVVTFLYDSMRVAKIRRGSEIVQAPGRNFP